MKHKDVSLKALFQSHPTHQAELEQEKAEDFERDQLRKLVNDELRRYGMLLTRTIVSKGAQYRAKANAHTLYGQLEGKSQLFSARAVLFEGGFKECCVHAAKLLDELDKSQLPDTATGLD
jgi:multidrug resistance efflux pump